MTSEDTDLLVITCTHDQNDACLKGQTVSLQLCGDQRSSNQGLGKYFKRYRYDTARSTRSYISKIDTPVLTWNDIIEMNQSGLTQRSLKNRVMIKETNHTRMRNKSTDLRIKGKSCTNTRSKQPHYLDQIIKQDPRPTAGMLVARITCNRSCQIGVHKCSCLSLSRSKDCPTTIG
jgi:hypothetical protein